MTPYAGAIPLMKMYEGMWLPEIINPYMGLTFPGLFPLCLTPQITPDTSNGLLRGERTIPREEPFILLTLCTLHDAPQTSRHFNLLMNTLPSLSSVGFTVFSLRSNYINGFILKFHFFFHGRIGDLECDCHLYCRERRLYNLKYERCDEIGRYRQSGILTK